MPTKTSKCISPLLSPSPAWSRLSLLLLAFFMCQVLCRNMMPTSSLRLTSISVCIDLQSIFCHIDLPFQAQPDLAQREIDNANYANSHNHGHQRFHQRRSTNAEVEQLTTTSSPVKRGVTAPVIAGSKLLGASTNSPAAYYFPNQISESTPTLSLLQLIGSVVDSVTTGFGLYNGSGNLAVCQFSLSANKTDVLCRLLPKTSTISRQSQAQ